MIGDNMCKFCHVVSSHVAHVTPIIEALCVIHLSVGRESKHVGSFVVSHCLESFSTIKFHIRYSEVPLSKPLSFSLRKFRWRVMVFFDEIMFCFGVYRNHHHQHEDPLWSSQNEYTVYMWYIRRR